MIPLFLFELFLLFYLSRKTTQGISSIIYKLTKNKKITVFFLAIIFLPGTIVHEFSHAVIAALLRVPVGKMELLPEFDDNNLKLGSVTVGKTDIVRNFFIGIAPFIFGAIILFCVIYLILVHLFSFGVIIYIFLFYLIFTISNTMFSSKKDMEGAVEFFILIIALFVVAYFLGFEAQNVNWGKNYFFEEILKQGVISLSIPIIIDVLVVLFVLLIV